MAFALSNRLEANFCAEALNEAINRFGPPGIMNSDQGSLFISFARTDCVYRSGVRISPLIIISINCRAVMDGRSDRQTPTLQRGHTSRSYMSNRLISGGTDPAGWLSPVNGPSCPS